MDFTLEKNIPAVYRSYVAPTPRKKKSPFKVVKESSVAKKKFGEPPQNMEGSSEPVKNSKPKKRHSKYPERKRIPRTKYPLSYGAAPPRKYSKPARWPGPRVSSKKAEGDEQEDSAPDSASEECSSDEHIEKAIANDEDRRIWAIQWDYDYQQSLDLNIANPEKAELCEKVAKLLYMEMREVLCIVATSLNRPDLLNEYDIDIPIDELNDKAFRRIQHFIGDPYGYFHSIDLSNIEYRIRYHSICLEARRAENDDADVPDTKTSEDKTCAEMKHPYTVMNVVTNICGEIDTHRIKE